MNHPKTTDERRRAVEAKLLQFKYRHLCALSTSDPLKKVLASEVQSLIDGVVLLGIPDEQAWTLYLDGQNCDSTGIVFIAYSLATAIWRHLRRLQS